MRIFISNDVSNSRVAFMRFGVSRFGATLDRDTVSSFNWYTRDIYFIPARTNRFAGP